MIGYIVDECHETWTIQLANSCTWALCATAHRTLNASLAQLIFGCDMLFDLAFQVQWLYIGQKHAFFRLCNNQYENAHRVPHDNKIGDKVLLSRNILQSKLLPPHCRPFTITKIYSNGTIKINKGIVPQTVSMHYIFPYFS